MVRAELKAQDAFRNPRVGWVASCAFCVLGDVCARGVRRVFVPALCFLGLRCVDAGHPSGLFTVRGCSQIFCKIKYVSELNER